MAGAKSTFIFHFIFNLTRARARNPREASKSEARKPTSSGPTLYVPRVSNRDSSPCTSLLWVDRRAAISVTELLDRHLTSSAVQFTA